MFRSLSILLDWLTFLCNKLIFLIPIAKIKFYIQLYLKQCSSISGRKYLKHKHGHILFWIFPFRAICWNLVIVTKFCFYEVNWSKLISFYSSWNNQTFGFLMISGGIDLINSLNIRKEIWRRSLRTVASIWIIFLFALAFLSHPFILNCLMNCIIKTLHYVSSILNSM